MAKVRSIESLNVDSTVLCCNFANTVSSWFLSDRYDYLQTYEDFIKWCLKLNVTAPESLELLQQASIRQPDDAKAALARIKEIRYIVYRLIAAVAADDKELICQFLPPFNLLLRVDAVSRQRLIYKNGKFNREQVGVAEDLIAPVWLLVESLAIMLAESSLNRIKQCPKCGWVFLDETKNAKRRWCNPRYCGSSDKMMRYNQKKKQQSS